ncbi:MAG TPA: GtrA family protein [Methanocella sp.]|jgi:putative flippase GtrA
MAGQVQQAILRYAGSEARAAEITRLAKFVFVGVLNTIVGYGAFFILSYSLNYLVALIIAHTIGVIHSFLWNKYWTFRTGTLRAGEMLRFASVYLVTLAANIVVLGFMVDCLHADPRLGQIVALPLVTIASYAGHKYWSFRQK